MGYHCLFREHITLYFIIFLKILASKDNCYIFIGNYCFLESHTCPCTSLLCLFLNNLRKNIFILAEYLVLILGVVDSIALNFHFISLMPLALGKL